MPPIIPGAPWWANLVLLLVAVLVSSGATVLIAHLSTRRRLDDLKAQQTAITEQVVNSHAGQPNLREDVDQLKADARGNALILARLERHRG